METIYKPIKWKFDTKKFVKTARSYGRSLERRFKKLENRADALENEVSKLKTQLRKKRTRKT